MSFLLSFPSWVYMQCNLPRRGQERDKKDKMHKDMVKYFILSLESISVFPCEFAFIWDNISRSIMYV
jgi:hypothetical protein